MNREIRVREVRVIGPEGEQLGILPTPEAFKQAQEGGYDLVEVAPTSVPPVCRIMDYGKYKYELSKKDHQSRRHQKSTQVKEIKLRPRTDKHDLEIKIRQIKGFLEEGNKTKVVLTYRGREMANQEMGRVVMNSVISELSEAGTIEYAPRMEGRSLIMIVARRSVPVVANKQVEITPLAVRRAREQSPQNGWLTLVMSPISPLPSA